MCLFSRTYIAGFESIEEENRRRRRRIVTYIEIRCESNLLRCYLLQDNIVCLTRFRSQDKIDRTADREPMKKHEVEDLHVFIKYF